ncbi:nucleoside hydrolase [Leifsonia aquatica]|uniref:nucleoside hydrolase n=1 Tax=Leifsonia aquatica TaxID=144185 RepID=UPI0004683C9F|nr:nucleoside hydrolase [Leifsonia aquatica]
MSGRPPREIRRLIIDCDPGNGMPAADVDDGLALALAAARPDLFSLDAITVVSGNTHRDVGFAVARDFVTRLGLEVPVHAGAERALVEPPNRWRDRQDANESRPDVVDAWSTVRRPGRAEPGLPDAAVRIVELLRAAPGEYTIVAIGPLTNIAMALELEPRLPELVRELVIMGGAFDVPGFLQELNFGIDPEAAHLVLASGAPITLVPLDTTSQTLFTHADLDRLRGVRGPVAEYVLETTRPWIDYAAAWRRIDGCLLHDPLTVALLIEPDLVEYEERIVDVELSGSLTRGRAVWWTEDNLRLHVGLRIPHPVRPIRVATRVDNRRLVDLLIDAYAGRSQRVDIAMASSAASSA